MTLAEMVFAKKTITVQGVADWRLCLGCGACAYICPQAKIDLVDAVEEGIRPIVSDEHCEDCRLCLNVCPAYENDHSVLRGRPGTDPSVLNEFGPIIEIWEGYAADDEMRYRAASGGAITALALYCLEQEHAYGVLHLQGDPNDPIRNRTCLSQSRAELLAGSGSRYAPGSVCDGLDRIESAPSPCVFIGQPSEVTALRKAEQLKPGLHEKVGLAISFFCAGSPATKGTIELLRSRGIDAAQVAEVRYRGLGWPGMFAVRRRDQTAFQPLATYKESWGALQRFRPYGIHLFPDMSGEDADISCADAWHRSNGREESEGHSLLVVRTERGRQVLRAAREAGYLVAERVDAKRLLQAQQSILGNAAAIWGRVQTFRLLGLPVPKLRGFPGFRAWLRLPAKEKLRSTLGTARRALQRGYYRPLRFGIDTCVLRPTGTRTGDVTKCPASPDLIETR